MAKLANGALFKRDIYSVQNTLRSDVHVSPHLDHVLLHTLGVGVAQNGQELIVGDEEETRKGVSLSVQVIVQRFLAFLQPRAEILKVRQTVLGVASLLDVRVFVRFGHDLKKKILHVMNNSEFR